MDLNRFTEKAQEALFLVNAGGGGHISIYDANRNQARIAMLNGKPTLVLQEKGQVAFEQSPISFLGNGAGLLSLLARRDVAAEADRIALAVLLVAAHRFRVEPDPFRIFSPDAVFGVEQLARC